ncbi:methionine--tRNA ligase [Roseomonas aerophila]|uniref:Methionine--tRNA ligase n=1 Tax=Teichococcus aerophilus TaxID=1224513 RepID=A0ABR7RS74_9PROT|nr:methionine--tRNA ligase [Pseudoroseomonas aerophila]MBC9209474.1 methionine--tRNA ligase [Pseudoroseomonas aerophila]
MTTERRCYLTTPIYYVNDKPHIGHAYTSLATDVLARWKRMSGYQVHFLTGTDEHGQKVEKAAEARGMDPQAFTDQVSQAFRDLAVTMNFSNDDFIRTTEERHKEACVALWKRLEEKGEIYLGAYEGWYAVRDEAFYGPDEITEKDGQKFAPTGAPVEWVREPSYFFRLGAWQERLLEFYDANPDFIAPQTRRNEVVSFVKSGLSDLSISRTSFKWGVKVPGDEAHVMYVWVDALTNYITALGYPDENAALWKFWPADVHFVGKDILRFHTIYWPALLMAAGLPTPKRVFAHGWWTNEGQKISKSLGNVIDPVALVEQYGLDPVRFFLLREVPFGNDGDFSRKSLVQRLNSELANDLGNLAQRTLSLIQKNCEGLLPTTGEPDPADAELLDAAAALPGRVDEALNRQAFHEALERIQAVSRLGNAWIDAQKPWSLKKTDLVRMASVLRHLHTALRALATVLQPFMPDTMERMLDQLAVPADARTLDALAVPLPDGTPLPPPSPLFQKILDDAV